MRVTNQKPVEGTPLPTVYGRTELRLFHVAGVQIAAQIFGLDAPEIPVRIHSQCLTSEVFGSLRCDCRDQREAAQAVMRSAGAGVLLYTFDEGRGIGLADKIRAYRLQQEVGLDTIDANLAIGRLADERDYRPAVEVLAQLGLRRIALLTNNPDKLGAVRSAGFHVRQVDLRGPTNEHNAQYLVTKQTRCGHSLEVRP